MIRDDIPRCCPLCMGRLAFEKGPPGTLAASCKGCAAWVLVLLTYPRLP